MDFTGIVHQQELFDAVLHEPQDRPKIILSPEIFKHICTEHSQVNTPD